jgi:hypothetical protein
MIPPSFLMSAFRFHSLFEEQRTESHSLESVERDRTLTGLLGLANLIDHSDHYHYHLSELLLSAEPAP